MVTFRPEPGRLQTLVETLAQAVPRIFLFNNAPLDPALRATLRRVDGVRFIDAATNLGVGAGLNILALAAALEDHERLILFDQDSRPADSLIPGLVAVFDDLVAAGRRPTAVGPRLVAPAHDPSSKAPRYRPRPGLAPLGRALPVDFLPTSGTLVDLGALRRSGYFRADYFIDAIDLEWCFRVWARGGSCWLAGDLAMEHTVGSGTVALPFGFRMPEQRPFRMYCHLRNTLYGFRLPHVPLRWKARQAGYMAVQALAYAHHHGWRRAAVGPLAAGLRDGLLGRLGVPPGAPGQ